jgi:FdrA protein
LEQVGKSLENTIIDMGDDEFTQGRPHPMIDPSLRDARIREEAADPSTAVILFDVVLGYGSALEPTSGLIGVISSARARAQAEGRHIAFVAYVCGTDQDPQNRTSIVASLKSAGVFIASSNSEAAVWSAQVISERKAAIK